MKYFLLLALLVSCSYIGPKRMPEEKDEMQKKIHEELQYVIPKFKDCFKNARQSDLPFETMLRFEINRRGSVEKVTFEPELPSRVRECGNAAIYNNRFPQPREKKKISVKQAISVKIKPKK